MTTTLADVMHELTPYQFKLAEMALSGMDVATISAEVKNLGYKGDSHHIRDTLTKLRKLGLSIERPHAKALPPRFFAKAIWRDGGKMEVVADTQQEATDTLTYLLYGKAKRFSHRPPVISTGAYQAAG